MEREEEEEKVFVCSLAYSTLMDSSGATDQVREWVLNQGLIWSY